VTELKWEYKIQSIDRAVGLLDLIAGSPRPLTLREVTEAMGMHKSTAHRFLQVLRGHGLLEVSERGLWRLGSKLDAWMRLRGELGGAK